MLTLKGLNSWNLWSQNAAATRICSTTPTGSSQTRQLHALVSKWLIPSNMFIPEVSCIVISSQRISWRWGCSHRKVKNCRGRKIRFQRGIVGVVMVRPGTSLQVFSKWSRCYITEGGTSSIVHFLLLCLFFHLRFLHLVLHIPTPPEDGCAKESWQCLHHRFWPCQTLPESTHQPAHSVSEWSCFGTLHFRNVAFCSKWWYRKLRLHLI